MSVLSSVILFIHIMSAMVWLGGMVFVSFALAPALGALGEPRVSSRVLSLTVRRFRRLVWVAIPLLVITGVMNVLGHNVTMGSIVSGTVFTTLFGKALALKLLLVLMMLVLTLYHEFIIGPRSARLGAEAQDSPELMDSLVRMRVKVTRIARVNLALGVLVVACAVMLR